MSIIFCVVSTFLHLWRVPILYLGEYRFWVMKLLIVVILWVFVYLVGDCYICVSDVVIIFCGLMFVIV